jgi:hypothetical protein
MLYRRTPRNPPTLLLRIVATAGAGTLIGMASCGGETTTANGSVAIPANSPAENQGDDSAAPFMGFVAVGSVACGPNEPCGSLPLPEADGGPVGVVPCEGFCGGVPGSVGYIDAEAPIDGSVSFPDAVAGSVAVPGDAGPDAHHVGIIGVVVEPHDAGETTCPPLCGVVIGLGVNPH